MKRTIKGLVIGLLIGGLTLLLIIIPVFGVFILALQAPAIYIANLISIPYQFVVVIMGGLIGALLGYLKIYKIMFIIAIVGLVILIGSSFLYFMKDFAETLANF